jgi:hypothetical protein
MVLLQIARPTSVLTSLLFFFKVLRTTQTLKMPTIISLVAFTVLAEVLRRCCMAIILAFTGPLSKIPGPLINKFSILPWLYQCLTGNMINVAPGYFEKYGDIVRIGTIPLSNLRPSSNHGSSK